MSTHSGMWVSDTSRPTFDPNIDIATVVFSHVQCVKTRDNLALVSKLWRDASKPAAAYPLRFDFGAFPDMIDWIDGTSVHDHLIACWTTTKPCLYPTRESLDFLVKLRNYVCELRCCPGESKAAEVGAREQPCSWVHGRALPQPNGTCPLSSTCTRTGALGMNTALAAKWHLPALQYLHENGCPWDSITCYYAADNKHWDCLQYLVDNKCPGWEKYAKNTREHLR